MAEDWLARSQRIIDEAEKAAAAAAPTPGAAVPPAEQPWQQRAETIAKKGEAGTLPSEAQITGQPAPPPTDRRSLAGAQTGLDQAVGNILRYVGPYIGMPETYNAVDAGLHGATLGAGDVARGYQRDIITGQPWGTGAGEVKTARDEFATQYPAANIAGNVVGGVAMPLPGIARAGQAIAQIPSGLGRLGASLGLGGLLGGTTGAVSGAIDEAPAGGQAALEGAKQGGMMGAALGTALPAAITAGTAGLRSLGRFFGPQLRPGQEAAAGRQLLDAAKDPAAVQDVASTQGPPAPPPAPPPPGPRWETGPRNLTPKQQLEQRLADDAARTDPNAGVLLPGQEAGMPARPTVGQITEDPGIQALENRLVAGILKKDPNTWTQAEQDLARKVGAQSDARTAALRGQADPTADPYNVKVPLETAQRNLETTQAAETAAGQQRGADLATSQEAATQAAQQRLQSEQARLGRDLTAEERGDLIRGEQAAGKATSKQGGVALNEQLAAADATTDQTATAAAARAIQKGMLKNDAAQTGKELEIFDKALMQGKAMPLAETLSLRSQITDEVRRVQQGLDPNADQRSVPRLVQLRQKLDETLEPHVAGLDDATGALYRQRQDYWKQHAETFKNSTVGDILQGGQNAGGYRMLPENVATRILQNNSTAEAHLAAGGSQESLRGALVDDLYRFAKGRPLTDDMLTTWRSNRQGALRAAPGLDAEIGNVGQAQRAIDDLTRTQKAETVAQSAEMTTLAQAQKAERDSFEAGSIGKVLKGDPGPQIASMLSGNNAVPDLMLLKGKIAGDAAAEAGLKRAVVNFLTSNRFVDAQSGQINPRVFRGFLNDKAAALEIALGEDGMKVLRAIDADLQRSKPGSPVMAGANKGGTPSSYASLFRAVMEGKRGDIGEMLSPPVLMGAAMVEPTAAAAGLAAKTMAILRSRGINGVNDVLAEAVQNPAFARAIMMKATPDNMPLAERALEASLQAGRQGPAAGYDYTGAEKRQREGARRRLLEPVP